MSAKEPRSVAGYRRWLRTKIAELTAMHELEPDDQLWDYSETIVDEAARRAALLGLSVVYDARLNLSHLVTSYGAVRFLSECLAILPTRSKVTVNLTPPQIAERYGVSPDTVRRWIESGQLRAVNIASPKAKRLRYRIEPEALAEFDKQRAAQVKLDQTLRRRRRPIKLLVTRYSS